MTLAKSVPTRGVESRSEIVGTDPACLPRFLIARAHGRFNAMRPRHLVRTTPEGQRPPRSHTERPGIPATGPGDDHHAKLAARLRYATPATQLGRETRVALTFELDQSTGAGQEDVDLEVADLRLPDRKTGIFSIPMPVGSVRGHVVPN